jgi:hypothetical protein
MLLSKRFMEEAYSVVPNCRYLFQIAFANLVSDACWVPYTGGVSFSTVIPDYP